MTAPRQPRIPKLCKHPDDRAYVRIRGRFHYLGRYGTPEAQQRYHAFMAEIAATGLAAPPAAQPADITVIEALAQYVEYARAYYGSAGQTHRIEAACKAAVELYGRIPAREFSPLKLKAVQALLVDRGYTRTNINAMVGCLKQAFRWLAANEIIPAETAVALTVVAGLRRGKTKAREPEPVEPVPIADVEQTLAHLPSPLAALVRLQLLTGARPGELLALRPVDVDTTGDVWTVRLAHHKTAHHGKPRTIYVGPQGQAVLKPFLLRPADAYCFSPREAIAERAAQAETHRRPNQKPNPRKTDRRVQDRYTIHSYRRAIERACQKVNEEAEKKGAEPITSWRPNQLRHTAATLLREQFGLDAAQVVLGHSTANTTQIYAALDQRKAMDVIRRIG